MPKLPRWFIFLAFVVTCPTLALAGPMLVLEQQGITITVYSEDCALKNVVSNLPKRATWTEKGKTYEGCAGGQPDAGVVMLYFKEDRSVAVVPMQAFRPLTGV